jgi:hypothetical protein
VLHPRWDEETHLMLQPLLISINFSLRHHEPSPQVTTTAPFLPVERGILLDGVLHPTSHHFHVVDTVRYTAGRRNNTLKPKSLSNTRGLISNPQGSTLDASVIDLTH